MAKMIEVRLHSLTCEFASNGDEEVEVNGLFQVLAFDKPSSVTSTDTIYDFPNGPVRMREGDSLDIDKDIRILMATPSVGDPPGYGSLFVKFGGNLAGLGNHWETLHTTGVINTQPWMRRFYFNQGEKIVRADFSTVFVHYV
jgi:hypothetical protein